MAAIISLLLGMVLGQRFKVLILAPAIVLILLGAIGAVLAHPASAVFAGETAAVSIAGLQIGYLAGIGIRHLIVVARARRMRANSLAGGLTPRRSAR